MVAPSLLVMKNRGGAAPSVHRLTAGTTTSAALDGTFGGNSVFTVAGANAHTCSVREFKGAIYAVIGTGTASQVYKRNPGVGWTQVFTAGGGANNRCFLAVVNTGMGPVLAFFHHTGTTTASLSKSTDGTSWSTTALGTVIGGDWVDAGVLIFRGQIWAPYNQGSDTAIIDVNSATYSTVARPATGNASLVSFRGRIFAAQAVQADQFAVYELQSGAWVKILELQTQGGVSGTGVQNGLMPVAFNWRSDYIGVIFWDGVTGTTGFWNFAKLTPSGSSFTVTYHPTVIPAGLQNGGGAANKHLYRWTAFVDNETSPTAPKVYVWVAASTTGTWSAGEYIDDATEILTSASALAYNEWALASTSIGGGEMINTTDSDLFPDDVSHAPGATAGTIEWSITMRGGNGNNDKTIRGYFSNDESPEMLQMTLTGTPTGGSAIRVDNEIQNARADGTVTHTFLWAAEAQGLASGQPVHWKFHVITP